MIDEPHEPRGLGATFARANAFFVYAGAEFVVARLGFTLLTLRRGERVATGGLLVTLWGSLKVGRILFGIVADRMRLVHTDDRGDRGGRVGRWRPPAGSPGGRCELPYITVATCGLEAFHSAA